MTVVNPCELVETQENLCGALGGVYRQARKAGAELFGIIGYL